MALIADVLKLAINTAYIAIIPRNKWFCSPIWLVISALFIDWKYPMKAIKHYKLHNINNIK